MKKFDKLLIIDLEATCWKNKPPNGQMKEIIEIGICEVKISNFNISKTKSIIVKPENSKVSDFCTRLTTLTQDDVNKGMTLFNACSVLINEFNSLNYTWASWGNYDYNQFVSECNFKNIEYPFGNSHINLKNLFAIKNNLQKEYGVQKALRYLKMDFEGTPHRGIDDACNIAKLAKSIFRG